MDYQSVIHAFNKVLLKFTPSGTLSFPEEFAVKRFLKKFQRPDSSNSAFRSQQCWTTWKENDESLHRIHLPLPGEWYRARHNLHKILAKPFTLSDVDFSNGSEFVSTRGKNSLEAKLCHSVWTCTPSNFEQFARLCYGHKGLKRAAARRYDSWFAKRQFDLSRKQADRFLFERFRSANEKSSVGFSIFSWKLHKVVSFVHGSRFSTVPKNNEVDRPIDIQPLANILVQRSLGSQIRRILKGSFGCDLDTLADIHRIRIKDSHMATLDLKNASDLIALLLCEFLFPKWFFKLILDSRTDMTLGPDGNYHVINKVSSMGNGFTFELMTLILLSVCRVLDPDSSVFGDDIIISSDKASRLIELLESVGFQINIEKSFIIGPFRESCGANYHDDYGYIESYDFRWNRTIHDCVVTANKVSRLAAVYPCFKRLCTDLQRCIPSALRGGWNYALMKSDYLEVIKYDPAAPGRPSPMLSSYFHTKRVGDVQPKQKATREILTNLHLHNEDVSWFYGFRYIPKLRSNTVRDLKSGAHWAKYEMYLASGRVTKDIITGDGRWVNQLYIRIGDRAFLWKALKAQTGV